MFQRVGIRSSRYIIEIADLGVFARHASRKPVEHTMAVETDVPVTAKVAMTVSQSRFTASNVNGRMSV